MPNEFILNADDAKAKNQDLAKILHVTLEKNAEGIETLRRKLSHSYRFIIVLSVLIFLTGIALLSVPVFSAFSGKMDNFEALIAGGFGIADLIGLGLYGPIEKIHKLMGDMSQLILALNCNQVQTSLRLMEIDVLNDRASIGKAAESICKSTESHIKSIEKYFEMAKELSKVGRSLKTISNGNGTVPSEPAGTKIV